MNTFLTTLLILHIASGFTALVTGGLASLTKKGGKGHRRSGKIYFWAMTGVFITATLLGVLKGRTFLFMVGFFSYYLVVRGYRQLFLKGLGRTQKPAALDWFISSMALVFALGLIGWAVSQKIAGVSFWPVPLVFGIISTGFAFADIKLYLKGPKYKQHWLVGHIASMGGGYIATWTAFVVTNIHFLPPVLVWLLPSAVGGFLISYSIRKYVPKPKRQAAVALLVGGLLCQTAQAQTVYGRMSIEGVGANLYVQLKLDKTDSSFSLRQRVLPGNQQPLFYTAAVKVSGDMVSGNAVLYQGYRYTFNGMATADTIALIFTDAAGCNIGQLTGSFEMPQAKPTYSVIAAQILDTLQHYIFNKAYLDSTSYKTFAVTLKQYGFFLQDDVEFVGAVNREMRKLPFTHCYFTTSDYNSFVNMVNSQFSGERPIEYKDLPNSTAYLKITSFNGSGSNIAAQMESIIKAKKKNLVIDLRGNAGGGAGAALQLVKYLSPTYKPAGALVTNKWADSTARQPTGDDYKSFYTFTTGTTLDLIEALKKNAGVVLAVTPSKLQYKGAIYILTDNYTASTCEPLVYAIKQSGKVIIIGERTRGAMLSAGGFWLNTGYVLSLPVADYFTADGVRLDKKGIEPTVTVPAADALTKAQEMIAND